jgi:hypothetical protein
MKISILTAVRDRPGGFEFISRFVESQNPDGLEWVLVDDSEKPVSSSSTFSRMSGKYSIKYLRKEPSEKDCTYLENLRDGLSLVSGEYLFLCEDDDWRCPGFLSECLDGLREASCSVGMVSGFPKYHLPTRKYCHGISKEKEESVVLSGIKLRHLRKIVNLHFFCRSSIGIPALGHAVSKGLKWDKNYKAKIARACDVLWRQFDEFLWLRRSDLVVEIKGIPGRGITSTHRDPVKFGRLLHDEDGSALNSFIGSSDADFLRSLVD